MSERRCSHPECPVQVTGMAILCVSHWHKTPPRVRAAIQERIHGWKKRDEAIVFYKGYLSNLKRQERSAQ